MGAAKVNSEQCHRCTRTPRTAWAWQQRQGALGAGPGWWLELEEAQESPALACSEFPLAGANALCTSSCHTPPHQNQPLTDTAFVLPTQG